MSSLLLQGCGPSAREVEALVDAAAKRGAGSRVSLASVQPGATRLFIFEPYTSIAQARRCLGPTAPDVLRGLEERDDVNVVVFQMPDGRLKSIAVSRAVGDFAPDAVGRSYCPDEAEFTVEQSAGRTSLRPVGLVPVCV